MDLYNFISSAANDVLVVDYVKSLADRYIEHGALT